MTWRWAALAVLALCEVTSGTSLRNIGPLADIDEISIDAMIGDALGIEGDPGVPLLRGDRKGAEDLKAALVTGASGHLKKAGVRVVQSADSSIAFNVFGGKFEAGGATDKNFFMLQIMVCAPNQDHCGQERTILGVVDDQGLARTVTNAALSALDGFLDDRSAYRKWKAK
jgi:hypothetical protein